MENHGYETIPNTTCDLHSCKGRTQGNWRWSWPVSRPESWGCRGDSEWHKGGKGWAVCWRPCSSSHLQLLDEESAQRKAGLRIMMIMIT